MGMWGLRSAWVTVGAFLLLTPAVLDAAPAAASSLRLVSPGAPAVSIALSVQPKPVRHGNKPASAHRYVWLTGTSNVPLENATNKEVRIDARFFAAESTTSQALTKTSPLLETSKPLRIAAGGTGVLPLNASLFSWGGWQDWLAAFGAGVVGQVGIKWAVLPALRSKHLPALDGSTSVAGS
jgi:hypothetical protein